jgi:hypothetical protein
LVAYGREDMSKLTKDEIIKILQNGYNSTIKMTEALHFNPKLPENHNIYISNLKNKYAMMFDGNDWTLTDRNDLLDRIYDDKKSYIEENIEEFVNSLSESRKNALKRWLDTNDEDKKIADIKERMKLMLYNKRTIPINARGNKNNDNVRTKNQPKKIPKDLSEPIQKNFEKGDNADTDDTDQNDNQNTNYMTKSKSIQKSGTKKSRDKPNIKNVMVVRRKRV